MQGPALRKLRSLALVLLMVAPGFAAGGAGSAPEEGPRRDGAGADAAPGSRHPDPCRSRAGGVLEVLCARNATVVRAGETALYGMGVRNNGNRTLEVLLSADGPAGWNWTRWPAPLSIPPADRTDVALEVRPPGDAMGNDTGVVTVTATAADDANLTDSAATFTTVEEVLGIGMWPERNETPVGPGETATCNITVEKTGNSRRPLFLDASVAVPGWAAAFDARQVNLEGAGVFTEELRLTAPPGARAGLRVVVNVSCHDRDRTAEASCAAAAVVRLAGNITVKATPELATLAPGGSALYGLELVNSGNGDDEVRPGRCDVPAGWSIGFRPGGSGGPNGSVRVPFGGSGRLDVELGAPPDAPSGDYRFPGEVLGSTGERYGFALNALVRRPPGVRLEAERDRLGGPPGGSAGFRLRVTNTGDGPGNVSLAASGLPAGWPAVEFTLDGRPLGPALELGPDATRTVTALVRIPVPTLLENVSLEVRAALAGGGNHSVGLGLDIQRADLRIVHLELPPARPRAGVPELVNLTVGNAGNADAGGVALELFVNGRLRSRVEIGNLPAGEQRVEGVLWVPGEGMNRLRFVIVGEDTARESNETDNEVSAFRTVPVAGTARAPGDIWIGVVVAALAVGSVLAARRLRRRK